jgi:hypothetical protein
MMDDENRSRHTLRTFRSEIGIKKSIIKDMLTLNVRLSDIFNTMKWEIQLMEMGIISIITTNLILGHYL